MYCQLLLLIKINEQPAVSAACIHMGNPFTFHKHNNCGCSAEALCLCAASAAARCALSLSVFSYSSPCAQCGIWGMASSPCGLISLADVCVLLRSLVCCNTPPRLPGSTLVSTFLLAYAMHAACNTIHSGCDIQGLRNTATPLHGMKQFSGMNCIVTHCDSVFRGRRYNVSQTVTCSIVEAKH